LNGPNTAGKDPPNSWQLRSSLKIGARHELDFAVRHAGALSGPDVPAYTTFDARLGWVPRPDLELSVTAQNLFGSSHSEYGPVATRSRIPSGIFLKLVWQM
jgi:iron complex outermembrane receptor protein